MSKATSKTIDKRHSSHHTGHVSSRLEPQTSSNVGNRSDCLDAARRGLSDLKGVSTELILGVLGRTDANSSRLTDKFVDSQRVDDRICETIGDAVLKAVLLEAVVDSLRKNRLHIEPSKVRQLVSALSTGDALVRALNYRALWAEDLPAAFPRNLDVQKRNADAIEVALGRCFLNQGMRATRTLVEELFKDVFAVSDVVWRKEVFLGPSSGDLNVQRSKDVSRIIFCVLGQRDAKEFLKCLQTSAETGLTGDPDSAVRLPALYSDVADWLLNFYHSSETQSRFASFIRQSTATRDSYAPVVGRAAFELCAKLHFIQRSHRHDSDSSKVTCQDMHQLWVHSTGLKELGLHQLLPAAVEDKNDSLRLQGNTALNVRLRDILFYDFLRADLLHVGVDLMKNYRGFDRVFCEVLIPQEVFASGDRRGLATIGELFP